jgi:uncharacterized protein YhdP
MDPALPIWRRALAWLARQSALTLAIGAALALLALGVRAALPWVLREVVNRRLAAIPGFVGHVDRVGVQLWHGGYTMHGLVIRKIDGRVDRPFVTAGLVEFSLSYRELLHGRVVGDVAASEASLNFIRGRTAAESQNGATGGWQSLVEDLFPISLNRLTLNRGRIHYEDTASTPRVDVWIERLRIEVTGLRNRPSPAAGAFPATATVEGTTIGGGRLSLRATAEPLARQPHFRFQGQLEGVALPALNSFLLAYGRVDVSQGEFTAYSEVEAADGTYHGYVKPFLSNLNFTTESDGPKSLTRELWKGLVARLEKLLRDRAHGEVATVVPFSGTIGGKPKIELWTAFRNLLHDAFVADLPHGFEGSSGTTTTSAPKPAQVP